MNTLYRIHTEATGDYRAQAIALVEAAFDGFTVLAATGYWKHTREESIVIEIVGDDTIRATVYSVAEAIRLANRQETVLVSETSIAATFIGGQA